MVAPVGPKPINAPDEKRQLFKGATLTDDLSYAIKIYPENPLHDPIVKLSVGKINKKITGADIHWHNHENVPPETLKQWVLMEKSRFNVKIEEDKGAASGYVVHIFLTEPKNLTVTESPPLLRSPREEKKVCRTDEPLTILTIENAHELALASKQRKDPLFNNIFHYMVDIFWNCPPSEAAVYEIVEIAEFLDGNDQKLVIEKLIQGAYNNYVTSDVFTRGLADILEKFQRMNYSQLTLKKEQIVIQLDQNLLNNLNKDHLVQLMMAIGARLNLTHVSSETIFIYLRTLIILLDVMIIVGLKNLDRKKHYDPFYRIIEKFRKGYNLKITFLAEYGCQLFELIKDNESDGHGFVRRSLHILKGLAIVADHVSITEPWHILGAYKSAPQFKKAVSHFKGFKPDWMTLLTTLEYAMFRNPEKLQNFENELIQKDDEIRKNLGFDFKEPLFVQGLLVLLQRIMSTYSADRPDIAISAMNIMARVAKDNHKNSSGSHKELPLFRLDKQYRDNICGQVVEILEKYKDDPNLELAAKAKKNLAELPVNKKSPSGKMTFRISLKTPDSLFKKAMTKAAPWVNGVFCFKERLENENQVKTERKYVLRLKESVTKETSELMEDRLKKALEDKKNKIVLILGSSGSGKTLFSKLHVLDRLSSYHSDEPLPIFVSLITLPDPVKHLMEGTLDQMGLLEHKESLKDREIHLVCDGFDEMYIKGKNPNGTLDNLYQSNNLGNDWKKVQLVMTCRQDFLDLPADNIYFWPEDGQKFEKFFHVKPLTREEIKIYIANYIKVRKEAAAHKADEKALDNEAEEVPFWEDPDKYYNFIKDLDLVEIAKNRFCLRVIVELAPSLDSTRKWTRDDLFDAYVTKRIIIEFKRQQKQKNPVKELNDYINFAIDLARNMQICNVFSVPRSKALDCLRESVGKQDERVKQITESLRIEQLEVENKIDEAKEEKEKVRIIEDWEKKKNEIGINLRLLKEDIRTAVEKQIPEKLHIQLFGDSVTESSLRRASFLEEKDGRIEFIHSSMREYFLSLCKKENRDRIEAYLQKVVNEIENHASKKEIPKSSDSF